MRHVTKYTLSWIKAGLNRHQKKERQMTTLFRTMTTTKEHSRRRSLCRLAGAGFVGALALGLIGSSGALGQVNPLQITALAQGFSREKTVNMHVNGPSDVLQALLVFQPGAETGWHIHPGPVAVVIKTGSLTETHSNGCMTVHPTGSVFFERAGEVHNAVNQTNGVAEVYATFFSPEGAQPLIPVANPGKTCRPGDKE
jgi:quercetin dioxygenase-like cupin family protein